MAKHKFGYLMGSPRVFATADRVYRSVWGAFNDADPYDTILYIFERDEFVHCLDWMPIYEAWRKFNPFDGDQDGYTRRFCFALQHWIPHMRWPDRWTPRVTYLIGEHTAFLTKRRRFTSIYAADAAASNLYTEADEDRLILFIFRGAQLFKVYPWEPMYDCLPFGVSVFMSIFMRDRFGRTDGFQTTVEVMARDL